MGVRVTTQPTVEPVTLVEAKAHLRVDAIDEDSYIQGLIVAARQSCETSQGRAYIEQTLEMKLDEWPCSGIIELPRPPCIEITSVKYLDGLGVEQTISSGDYYLDSSSDSAPAKLLPAYGKCWPAARGQAGAITIVYKAGYGTAGASVPQATRQAMLFLIGHWFENREAVNVGNIVTEFPMGVDRLLSHHKVYTIP